MEINNPGAIYKCNLNETSSEKCKPLLFDKMGNAGALFNKTNQWLGMSLDGGASENQPFVICAPRFVTNCPGCDETETKPWANPYTLYDTAMHGVCYWSADTSSDQPDNFEQVLNITKNQLIDDMKFIKKFKITYREKKYFLGEIGFSVHITENNEEILIGAPGVGDGFRGLAIRKNVKDLRSNLNALNKHEVADSLKWYNGDYRRQNTLFGYAISSGYFDNRNQSKLLYVASAPKECAKNDWTGAHPGIVYIFDFVTTSSGIRMKRYFQFQSEYWHEYFGYSLLVDDFNGDGYDDIAIGAPQNTFNETNSRYYTNGAVYIYTNLGTSPVNFTLQTILRIDSDKNDCRFGQTLSKAGDINHDGYNDLIVAAPFEGDGAIYIYFGSSNGLSEIPDQKIKAPSIGSYPQWFGHGISKGVDIDGNNYVDFAVGSPNADAVYIYKSYPVIKINATIKTIKKSIRPNDKSFTFMVCFQYESKFSIDFPIQLNANVRLIDCFGRAYFQNGDHCDGKNQCNITISLSLDAKLKCVQLEAAVIFKTNYIYTPIRIQTSYEVVNGIPNYNIEESSTTIAKEFCENCVALNPNCPKNVFTDIKFSKTGCKDDHCIVDLKVTSTPKFDSTQCNGLRLGVPSMQIEYKIENYGEVAYCANIFISIPIYIQFMKIPSYCEENVTDSNNINCTLTADTAIATGGSVKFNIGIDTGKLTSPESLRIEAKVFSNKNDIESNNSDNTVVDMVPVVDFSKIEIFGYSTFLSTDNIIKIQDETKKVNLTHVFEIENHGPSNISSLDVIIHIPRIYVNLITENKKEFIDVDEVSVQNGVNGTKIDIEWSFNENEINNTRDTVTFNNTHTKNHILRNLKIDDIFYFECNNSTDEGCMQGKFTVNDLNIDKPINVIVNIPIDMKSVAKITPNLVFITSVLVMKTSKQNCSSIDIVQNPYTIFSFPPTEKESLWIYVVVSSILGLFILNSLAFTMYKLEFFRRTKHEELIKLKLNLDNHNEARKSYTCT
ncbi:integrin alpha-PS5-like [Contarinia nasturtii]|uniref:integrin alpha-PS5-like n=1 Tax=Contarinia nasturtii TaxID=265458 RepID=UPI0012D38C87|nr:integrin alpha-PS5-like [Contarinia nasturtii]